MIKCNNYINLLEIYITLHKLPYVNFISLESDFVEDCDEYWIVNECGLNFKNPYTNIGVIQITPK